MPAGVLVAAGAAEAESWRGLVVAEEHRWAPYDRDDYPNAQSVEREIIEHLGTVLLYCRSACADSGPTRSPNPAQADH